MFWNIDIKCGLVSYDDISFLTDDFNCHEQIDFLKEDMLQINFPRNLVLDVSWRPSFEEQGAFYVWMVKDQDWQHPIAQAKVFDVISVRRVMSEFITRLIHP